MSYRETRDFTEMMRVFGYPRLISIENFRSPNFDLVAEVLIWLVRRFDPDANISTNYDSETQRVTLVRSVAEFMAIKANIKLNTKRLYQADGHAVKELLKITTLLYNALKNNDSPNAETFKSSLSSSLTDKLQDLKSVRELASRITTEGASFYDLLGQELDLREARYSKVNMPLEISSIEKGLKQSINNINNTIAQTKQMIENISTSEASLDLKIEKRQAELERNQKRLESLKKVRPAFLEEYEKLEKDLKEQYEAYVLRYRCVTYLEQQLEEYEQAKQSKIDAKHEETRKLVEKMRQEDTMKLLDGTSFEDEAQLPNGNSKPLTKGRIRTASGAGSRAVGRKRRVYGSMMGGDDDLGSLDSDSDLFFDDDDDDDENDDDEDEDEEDKTDDEIDDANGRIESEFFSRDEDKTTTRNTRHSDHSDDDF